jgi:hypothetical protein
MYCRHRFELQRDHRLSAEKRNGSAFGTGGESPAAPSHGDWIGNEISKAFGVGLDSPGTPTP